MKNAQIGRVSGPRFRVFGLKGEIYSVNLHIQYEYRKVRTNKNSIFGHFLSTVNVEAAVRRCSIKNCSKKFHEIHAINTCARVSFQIEMQAMTCLNENMTTNVQ